MNNLNRAVLEQIIECIQKLDDKGLSHLNVSVENVGSIKLLTTLELFKLVDLGEIMKFVDVKINNSELTKCLSYLQLKLEDDALVAAYLENGASSELMKIYFGLSFAETAAMRKFSGLDSKGGRPVAVGSSERLAIINRYKKLDSPTIDRRELLLIISNEYNVGLTKVFNVINHYESEGRLENIKQ